jgi:methionyl-tRNA synthetase
MAVRYQQGTLVATGEASPRLTGIADEALASYRRAMDSYALHEGAAAAFRIVDATNEFIAETAPWTLAKDPGHADRLTQVLFDAAEAIRVAAVLLAPIMPTSSAEILRRLGLPAAGLHLDRDGAWRNQGERTLAPSGPLWPRKESPIVSDASSTPTPNPAGQNTEPASTAAPGTAAPGTAAPGTAATGAVAPSTPAPGAAAAGTPLISIDDFMKVELRVAKVLSAERVPKSNKLLKLLVDTGVDQRTVVAGIAEAYEPEALIGRSVTIVFNLKPAKLMGIESNGMVLAASPDGGKPMLVGFEQPPPAGTRVR